ncbi:hypothetical protein [Nitratifractor sp.]
MNPLGTIPIYLAFCSGKPEHLCHRIPRITATAILTILILSL